MLQSSYEPLCIKLHHQILCRTAIARPPSLAALATLTLATAKNCLQSCCNAISFTNMLLHCSNLPHCSPHAIVVSYQQHSAAAFVPAWRHALVTVTTLDAYSVTNCCAGISFCSVGPFPLTQARNFPFSARSRRCGEAAHCS